MNLLTEPTFTRSGGATVSLPALFAAMAQGEVRGFPSLRPHQRPAWHMFLVQLGALAALKAEFGQALPDDTEAWASALRALTPDWPDDEPWRLVIDERSKPAFMQPPDPGNLKWSRVSTPDALDLLITSRNHDVKKAVGRQSSPEDWVFALISLQTCEGYGGAGNHGIARMNGGSSSRPMLGLAPGQTGELSVDVSAWWRRDMQQLVSDAPRRSDSTGKTRGSALLWCIDWPEGGQLKVRDLDPLFIEVCRRVRLIKSANGIEAARANSKAARVLAKPFKGNLDDPWAPVHKAEGKALTLAGGDFNYARLRDLLFSGEWKKPRLATPADNEKEDMLLVAEALSRGNSKTEGFKSRHVMVPGNVLPIFSSDTAGEISKAQLDEIKAFDDALRKALAVVAAGGNRDNIQKKHYAHATSARKRFDRAADRLFFSSLWERLEVAGQSEPEESRAKRSFLNALRQSAEKVLEATIPSVPCPSILRPRAESRAREMFFATLRKHNDVKSLFVREEADVAA